MNPMVGVLLSDDSGAVTVDWVALVAGSLLFGIAVIFVIFNDGVKPVSHAIGDAGSSMADGLGEPVSFDIDFAPGNGN